MSSVLKTCCLAVAAASCFMAALPAQASLVASTSIDIPAARAQFLSRATVLDAYNWSSLFAPGAHSLGNGNPFFSAVALSFATSDGALNFALGTNGVAQAMAPGNWIDGPGFNTMDGLGAAADLAINGAESFDLVFGSPYTSVGLAIATGLSNFPNEVDLLGASFDFVALDAAGQAIGSASLVLPAGAGNAAWVTLVSSAPMHRLQVRETAAASINDQYFSNVYATPADVTAVPVPEPSSWLLAGLGLGLAGLNRYARMRASTRSTITPL